MCIVDLFMSLQLYVKRTVHHQLPNVLALWSKATSLSLVRMALSASQKQNRSPGFSNASQTFRCPQSVLAFVEHLDTKHCGSCTTYPGTCGKKTYYWLSLSQNGCPTCNPSYFLLSFIISYDYSILFLKHFWHSPVHPTKIPAEMSVPKKNTLLSPTSAFNNMLPRHKSMTFQGSHQKWHRPAAIRTKISWWKPTTWQLHLHLMEDLDLRFPTRFLQLPPRCKEKGDLKGTKSKVFQEAAVEFV